jgi:hypothetical protein
MCDKNFKRLIDFEILLNDYDVLILQGIVGPLFKNCKDKMNKCKS